MSWIKGVGPPVSGANGEKGKEMTVFDSVKIKSWVRPCVLSFVLIITLFSLEHQKQLRSKKKKKKKKKKIYFARHNTTK